MSGHETPGDPAPGHSLRDGLGRTASSDDARERFLDFYDEQYPKLVAFVRVARNADLAAAEDAVQSAFAQAWRLVQAGGWGGVRHPQAWIRTVALRQHDHPDGQRRIQPATSPVPDDLLVSLVGAAPAPTTESILALDVLKALRTLHDDQARTVMAFTLDGLTATEIADQLGITAQRVRNQRTKARRHLQARLAHHRAQEGDITR